MLGKFFASSAPWQTQQIIVSAYDDQWKKEVDVQYKMESHCLKGWVNKADMNFFYAPDVLSIGNFF